jgi:hypothetical protein
MFVLQDLKNAFGKLNDLGKGELVLDVDGVRLVLARATAAQEAEVAQLMAELDPDTMTSAVMAESFFRLTLSRVIVQVGNLDLRGVTSIPTGEVVDGVAVRLDKTKAVESIVIDWSQAVCQHLMSKYLKFLSELDKETAGVLEGEPLDLSAEQAQLEDRLQKVKATQELIPPPPAPAAPKPARQPNIPVTSAPAPQTSAPLAPSFGDIPDSMGAATPEAIALEEARLQRVRAGQEPGDVLSPFRRTPPHLAAREAANEVKPLPVNQPAAGTVNPRFSPVKR